MKYVYGWKLSAVIHNGWLAKKHFALEELQIFFCMSKKEYFVERS